MCHPLGFLSLKGSLTRTRGIRTEQHWPLFPPSLSAIQVQAGWREAWHCPLDTFPVSSLSHVWPSVRGVFVGTGQEMDMSSAEEATIQNIPVKS